MFLELDIEHEFLIKNYFLISGLYDLREIFRNSPMDGNGQLKLTEEDVKLLSPVLFEDVCKTHKPLVHVLYGENDSPSFKGQSRAFARHLATFGFGVKEKQFQNCDHFEIVEELSRRTSEISNYIFKYIS